MSFLMDFLMGGASAAAAKLGSAPIDRSRLMLQAQGELLRQGRINRPYAGMFDAMSAVVRTEGSLGLWRGILCDVIVYYPSQALNFAFKDSFRQLFPWTRQQHGFGLFFVGTTSTPAQLGCVR
jgi:solute carrier family 25 (adenine nucleotide translocator) protein 4/5/6/31